ncbi:MAG: tetratricopeptide repeat protein [Acidobacteriota bacterium]|nr:tetratricopeptide repeat protein [Acidobacteriota bacterium]
MVSGTPGTDWLAQGVQALGEGRPEDAVNHFSAHIDKYGDHADAYNLLGAALHLGGQTIDAEKAFRRAVAMKPDNPRFLTNLAKALSSRNAWSEALDNCRRALSADPSYAPAHTQLGTVQFHLRNYGPARKAFLEACRLDSSYADAWNNLGNLEKTEGNLTEAEVCYRRAVREKPRHSAALNNLGSLFLHQGLADEALKYLKQATACAPELAEAWNNLGQVYQMIGDDAEARRHYERAGRLAPGKPLWQLRRINACPVIPSSNSALEFWRRRFGRRLSSLQRIDLTDHMDQITGSNAQIPYRLVYQGRPNLEMRRRYSRLFTYSGPAYHSPSREGDVRIAFLVTFGHEGIFINCTAGIIEHWGDTGARLTIACSRAGLKRLQEALPFEHMEWLPLPSDFAGALNALRKQHFDLVYYWEIGTDAVNYFLPFCRAAAVQCTSWGTSESTGLPNVDYYLTCKPWEGKGNPQNYSEQLVVLDRIPACFRHPGEASALKPADLGIDPDRAFYFCPQNPFKLHPDFDETLADLCRVDMEGQIVLVEGSQPAWTGHLRERLERNLPDNAANVIFLPRLSYPDYLALLKQADVILDPHHFSGGATSYEALSMGAPIVTLPGTFIRSRFTLGYYRQMGIDDCIAKDPEHFVNLAVEIAEKASLRRDISERILAAQHQLLEDRSAALQFERALVRLALQGRVAEPSL